MMTITHSQLDGLIGSNPHFLRRKESRRIFARELATFISYWSFQEMENFISEMKGLDLAKQEDRQVFYLFFENAFPGVLV